MLHTECEKCKLTGDCAEGNLDILRCKKRKADKRNATRRGRDQVMRDHGLVKVRGIVSGRTYWE